MNTFRPLTFQEALTDQDDLEDLCSDRELVTREPFHQNAFYGDDRILKMYADLPLGATLKVIIPHGVNLDSEFVSEAERDARLSIVHCYPPSRATVYREQMKKEVVLSASPFLYTIALLGEKVIKQRHGTIYFPHHSTPAITASMDNEMLAEKLQQLDTRFQPITVCIYWRDFNLGHHLPFIRRGFRIVSAGHRSDPNFLFRLYHLLSLHRFAGGNELGSHIFYAVAAGCPYFHLEGYNAEFVADELSLRQMRAKPNKLTTERIKAVFNIDQLSNTERQLQTANYYLGADYFRSPAELRAQFRHAEMIDKIGFWVVNSDSYKRLTIPMYFRRLLRSNLIILRMVKHRITAKYQNILKLQN